MPTNTKRTREQVSIPDSGSMGPAPVTGMLEGLRTGSASAQELVFKAFYAKLVAIATDKLKSMPRNSGDPEVAASSTLRSFFSNVKKGELDFKNQNSIYYFLLHTLKEKVLAQRRKAAAEKRQEDKTEGADSLELVAVTPHELTVITDNFFELLDKRLNEREKQVFAKSLNGQTQREIASQLGVALRTVESAIASVRAKARKVWATPSE